MVDEMISRQAAIDDLHGKDPSQIWDTADIEVWINELPSVQPDHNADISKKAEGDCISRQAAIDAVIDEFKRSPTPAIRAKLRLEDLPTVQPERTCVNCGRTANNGGWYADGRTRCPIEEHYALPKDGYCHLWEKRNFTDDDYPERRTDE